MGVEARARHHHFLVDDLHLADVAVRVVFQAKVDHEIRPVCLGRIRPAVLGPEDFHIWVIYDRVVRHGHVGLVAAEQSAPNNVQDTIRAAGVLDGKHALLRDAIEVLEVPRHLQLNCTVCLGVRALLQFFGDAGHDGFKRLECCPGFGVKLGRVARHLQGSLTGGGEQGKWREEARLVVR